jgi:hypothetical protein
MTASPNKQQETRIRRLARKHGYILRKSHVRIPNSNNFGRYMLVEEKEHTDNNGDYVETRIIFGSRFDASLETIERALQRVVAGNPIKGKVEFRPLFPTNR